MTNPHQPSILRWGTICSLLLVILIAEISAIHLLRTREQSTQAKIEAVNAAIVRLGPQAATKEQLEACVAEFKNGDKDTDNDIVDAIAGMEGVALSDVKTSAQGATRQVWMIAFTCATSELASVLDVINRAAYKIALTGMKFENRADETVAAEIYLETDKPSGVAR